VPQAPAVVPLSFDLGSETYTTFVDTVRTTLAAHPNPDSVQGHPVLTKQRFDKPPARLLHVELTAGDKSATLAVRDDNVYVIGFRAQTGNWYEFGYTAKGKQPIIPGAAFLECGFSYRDLVGGGTSKDVKTNLRGLNLGKSDAEAAVKKLAAYVHAGAPDEATKLALARLMIMVSEAARMVSVSATVNSGWAAFLAVPRPSGQESTIGWLLAICAGCHVIFIFYRYLPANVYNTKWIRTCLEQIKISGRKPPTP
jgi:hypothetical protein